jgi:HAD superfamily hydrolase (TIGR01509 family)
VNRTEQPVEAIVFDLFGVIAAFDKDSLPERLARHCSDPDDARRRLHGLMARREIITGAVTLAQVHRRLVQAHGLTLTYPQFEEAWLAPCSWPMPGMADLVTALSGTHRLVLLSNVDSYYWQVARAMQPELDSFKELLVSCDLGFAKPDPEAFLRASQAAGTQPEQCLFVDDTRANVEAARALGFQAHWFRNAPRLHRSLRSSTGQANQPLRKPLLATTGLAKGRRRGGSVQRGAMTTAADTRLR